MSKQLEKEFAEVANQVRAALNPGLSYQPTLFSMLTFAVLNKEVDWEREELDSMFHLVTQLNRILLFDAASVLPEQLRKEVNRG